MTTKCANPLCTRPFLYFRSGKIYLIDVLASNDNGSVGNGKRDMEYFWLCGACAQSMQVTLDRKGSVVVESLANCAEPVLGPASLTQKVVRAVA